MSSPRAGVVFIVIAIPTDATQSDASLLQLGFTVRVSANLE